MKWSSPLPQFKIASRLDYSGSHLGFVLRTLPHTPRPFWLRFFFFHRVIVLSLTWPERSRP